MIDVGKSYRPIEGDVIGVVDEVSSNKVHWRHKDTVFLIPIERFTEYFCKDESVEDSTGTDREGTERDTLRYDQGRRLHWS